MTMMARKRFASVVLAGVLALGTAAFAQSPAARYDAQIQGSVSHELAKKSAFRGVRSTVEDGIVTLSGTVEQYKYKLEAEKKARRQKHVQGVRDLLEVGGPAVSDLELRDEIAKKLAYDRIGYSNVFNSFTVGVQNGVVTVGGEARTPYDKASALAEASATKGVRDVVDQVKVAPASFYDDELRLRVARAIYGDSALFRYSIDPAAPVRIVVNNGHVALYGTVDNAMDRTIAGIRAGQVFGAFSVENHLETSGARVIR